MKKSILILIISLVSLFSCEKNNNPNSQVGKNNIEVDEITFPYKFIESKMESNNTGSNKMDLYVYDGKFNIDNLKSFCKSQKAKQNNINIYTLVIFDRKEYAGFPQTPLTAMYGIEEDRLKHIRIFYTYNLINGYSKLNLYETNAWESPSKQEDI